MSLTYFNNDLVEVQEKEAVCHIVPAVCCWRCRGAWWTRETWSRSPGSVCRGNVFQWSPLQIAHTEQTLKPNTISELKREHKPSQPDWNLSRWRKQLGDNRRRCHSAGITQITRGQITVISGFHWNTDALRITVLRQSAMQLMDTGAGRVFSSLLLSSWARYLSQPFSRTRSPSRSRNSSNAGPELSLLYMSSSELCPARQYITPTFLWKFSCTE